MPLDFTLQYITCSSLECVSEPEPEPSNNQQQQLQLVVPTTIIMSSTEQHQERSAFQDHEEQQQQQQQDGFIASGLSWFDKQREKKRREILKIQAEKQLQKIKDASSLLAAAADNSIASGNSGGDDDDDNISSSSLSHHQGHNNNNHNRTTPTPQPIGLSANRSKSIGSTASVDSVDVSCSKSGEGASGKFDLNDVVTLVANNNNTNYNLSLIHI